MYLFLKMKKREKIMKLLENEFFFILFFVGDKIKENYFFIL